MKHTAIVIASVAMLAITSQAADTPSASTNALTTTNAPHFSSKFAERLHQLRERDATNKVPDRASQQALFEQQMQQMQREHDEALKRGAAALPPLPPSSAVLPLPPSQPVTPLPRFKSGT